MIIVGPNFCERTKFAIPSRVWGAERPKKVNYRMRHETAAAFN